MKKTLLLCAFCFMSAALLTAQTIDAQVRDAVNALAARLNIPIEVSVGAITLAESGATSAFSRHLSGKINHYAVNNDLFRVVPLSRGAPAVRPNGPTKEPFPGHFPVWAIRWRYGSNWFQTQTV